jgi:hypothetical protein
MISRIPQLSHARAQACFGKTRNRVSGFIRLTIQTGLWTSSLAILAMVLYVRKLDGFCGLP